MTEIAAFAIWERRKAELAARKAAVMADPVQGFYLRHGRPPGRAERAPGSESGEGEEPGPALARRRCLPQPDRRHDRP